MSGGRRSIRWLSFSRFHGSRLVAASMPAAIAVEYPVSDSTGLVLCSIRAEDMMEVRQAFVRRLGTSA